jgi:hypothetical protein
VGLRDTEASGVAKVSDRKRDALTKNSLADCVGKLNIAIPDQPLIIG